MDRFEMMDMGDVSRVLGMNVSRDREKGTITIDHTKVHGRHRPALRHEEL